MKSKTISRAYSAREKGGNAMPNPHEVAGQITRQSDPDWRAAQDYAYRAGISALADLVYRIIQLEKKVAALTAQ
jgi:hypothetical protein